MATLLQIAQAGAPVLRKRAIEVTDPSALKIQDLIDNMTATCQENDGMGIAAPQVYVSKRIIIVATKPSPRYPHAPHMEPLALINPVIQVKLADGEDGWEGCLSMPGLRAKVWRSNSVTVTFIDRSGERQVKTFNSFAARVVQHEIDHLDGILFFDKADTETFVSEAEFQRLVREKRL